VFFFGFAKSEMENINQDQLAIARGFAVNWLAADDNQFATAIAEGELKEIERGQKAK
jgi:hypothetical protein